MRGKIRAMMCVCMCVVTHVNFSVAQALHANWIFRQLTRISPTNIVNIHLATGKSPDRLVNVVVNTYACTYLYKSVCLSVYMYAQHMRKRATNMEQRATRNEKARQILV